MDAIAGGPVQPDSNKEKDAPNRDKKPAQKIEHVEGMDEVNLGDGEFICFTRCVHGAKGVSESCI
jgi:hypothetical protein